MGIDWGKVATNAKNVAKNPEFQKMAANVAGHAAAQGASEIAKNHNNKSSIVKLRIPDVTGLNIYKAMEILSNCGFTVADLTVTPSAKYSNIKPNTVINTIPRCGKKALEKDLVKVFFIDEDSLSVSKVLDKKKQAIKQQKKVSRDQKISSTKDALITTSNAVFKSVTTKIEENRHKK